jgi:hypothetical protein
MEIIEQSVKSKRQADLLINGSGIMDILSTYGEVKIGGSYALNVMLRPDLDFFVIADKHDWSKVLDINSKIMSSKFFKIVCFANWNDFGETTPDDNMKGYYFMTKISTEDTTWKCDIWLITPDQDKSSEYTETFKKLLVNDDQRKQILTIKDHFKQGEKYVKGVDGKLIYTAVLEKNISTIEEFTKFAKLN